MNRRLPWWLWLTIFAIWSLLLVTPGSVFGVTGFSTVVEIGAGKFLHVGVYAMLAGAAGWLPGSSLRRTIIALLLIAHGELTESIQLSIPGRTGSLVDVLIDTFGVVSGYLLTRRWWPK